MKAGLLVAASVLVAVMATSPALAANPDLTSRIYAVTHVAPDDGLNLRSAPGIGGSVVVVLPSNAKGVLSLGVEKKVDNSTWIQVTWAGKQGWVNKYYLREDVDTSNYNPADTTADHAEVVMECGGTEPFWSVSIGEQDMRVNVLDGPQYTVPVEFRQQSANNTSIAVIAGNQGTANTTAFLQKVETCSDGMSDRNYPYSITAVLGSQQVVSGCCSIAGAE